jgi:hypothetical protein
MPNKPEESRDVDRPETNKASVSAMESLKTELLTISPGKIDEPLKISNLLALAWETLTGGTDEGMEGYKLIDRMEKVEWVPPVLRFQIERHGATVKGSSRADLHEWTIDLCKATAECVSKGSRQIIPMAPRLDVEPLAAEVAGLIRDGRLDERVQWHGEDQIRIKIGKILPVGSALKQTLEGRRSRFRKALTDLLSGDWEETKPNYYRKIGSK